MDEETQAGLFRVCNKSQRQGTSNESGTGLGLLLCKEFVEKNRGSIEVKSKPNEGSTFCITLPSDAN
jgi:signal transduction histidine kinase